MDGYTDAVLRSMRQYASEASFTADTLYFGGGTPSLLGGARLSRIVEQARNLFLLPGSEVTVECNPAGDLESLLPALQAVGVTRISLGMQSSVDSERRALGRRADSARITKALAICRQAGITNISLDLMLGIPHMSIDSLDRSLDFIIASQVPHISAYLLKVEQGTPFYTQRNTLGLPCEDMVCDQYLHTVERLAQAGLAQYEVSNFSLPGFESKHNLKYWNCEEYLGIGPSAHSYWNGKRFYQPSDLQHFIQGDAPILDGDGGSAEEKLMLALRLTTGVAIADLSPTALTKADTFVAHGLMQEANGHLFMTPNGFLISNTIIRELLPD